jgi:hypothetical protein
LEEFESYSYWMKMNLTITHWRDSTKFDELELWVNRWNAQMDNELWLLELADNSGMTQDEWYEIWSKSWKSWELDNIILDRKFHDEEQQVGYTQSVMPFQQLFYNFLVKSHMDDYKSWLRYQRLQDRVQGRVQGLSQRWSWEQIHARNVADYCEWLHSEL